MNQNDNQKDPKKPSEEELLRILEELKKQQEKKPKKVSISLGFLLHRNYLIHLAISLVINLVLFAVIIGFSSSINQPILHINLPGYFLGVILFTFAENFLKLLLFKYFIRFMLLSMGLMSIVVQIMILAIIDQLLIGFDFGGADHLIVFTFIFSLLRLIFSSYLRKILYGDMFIIPGGKK
jgi:uncharacterized membrane protein YvlD (DUF360 family)